jgi:hypothetical protein
VGQADIKGCRALIKINSAGTFYKNLIEFHRSYRDYLKLFNKPLRNIRDIDIVDDESGIPCASIFSSPEEIKEINSEIVLIDAISEGANIIPFFNEFPKNKKYVLLTNGRFSGSNNHDSVDQNYNHIVWNYFLQRAIFNNSTISIEYWQNQQYEYSINKQNIFCCLVGKKRPERDIFSQSLLKIGQGMSYIFTYDSKDLAYQSRKYDVNCDFSKYDTYESLLDYSHYSISNTIPIDLYNTCRFQLTVETIINNAFGEFHLTEKTIKPIIVGMPFVLMASSGYLERLKKLGFKTFESVWDESYDKIEKFEDRLQAIMNLILFLNNKFNWAANLSKIQEITDYNRMNLMYNNLTHKKQIINFAKVIAKSCS